MWRLHLNDPEEQVPEEAIEPLLRRILFPDPECLGSLAPEQVQMLVMGDKTVQSYVSLHQMIYLIDNLGAVHSNNAFIINKVNIAKDMYSISNLNTLLEISAAIINLPDLGQEIEHKHALLVKETRELANILYAKIAISAQEFISQNYYQSQQVQHYDGMRSTGVM